MDKIIYVKCLEGFTTHKNSESVEMLAEVEEGEVYVATLHDESEEYFGKDKKGREFYIGQLKTDEELVDESFRIITQEEISESLKFAYRSHIKKSILRDGVDEFDILYFLNKVNDQCGFELFEMYSSGSFLGADVSRKKYEKELNDLVVDIEKYRLLNNKCYSHDEDEDIIGLNYLVEIAEDCFRAVIMYDHEEESFYIN